MAKFALITGAYTARSVTAANQRCVNLYMEKNPDGEAYPFTCYPTPGLRTLSTAAQSAWRGLYAANDGRLYGVCGNTVYLIAKSNELTALGTIGTSSGPVSMIDNGTNLLLVDGSANGYTYKLGDTDSFAQISSTAFYGADTVIFSDGYFILNRPGTVEWYLSRPNEITFDALDFASKSANMDLLVGVGVTKRYVFLLGESTTEIWYNSGDTDFPYRRLPGVFIQYGCLSAASIRQMDGNIYWLATSPQGQAIVCRTEGMDAVQISTFALSYEISQYSDVSDAVGFTYMLGGHLFYVLWFPTADKTWQFDLSTGQWNELVWLDGNGEEHAHRCGAMAYAYGAHFVGDRETGALYAFDENEYTDAGAPIKRVRGFVHAVGDDFNRATYNEVLLYMETGNGNEEITGGSVDLSLRWSDTGGKSWGIPLIQSMGLEGEYLQVLTFQRLGAARNRLFEVSWSSPARTALCGAFAKIQANGR